MLQLINARDAAGVVVPFDDRAGGTGPGARLAGGGGDPQRAAGGAVLQGPADRRLQPALLLGCGSRRRPSATRASASPCRWCCIDLDRFKWINDELGHRAGDETLREAARSSCANSRSFSIVTRFGGDEFAVLLVNTPKAGAVKYAQRIKDVIERHRFPHGPLTVSVGVAAHARGRGGTAKISCRRRTAPSTSPSVSVATYRSRVARSSSGPRPARPLPSPVSRLRAYTQPWPTIDLEVLERIQRRVLWLSGVDGPPGQRRAPERRRPQGRRPPGLVGLGRQPADRALLRRAAARPTSSRSRPTPRPRSTRSSTCAGGSAPTSCRRSASFGGLQAYPSRRKNPGIVDLSTGSMGLGAVAATFGGLASRYLRGSRRRGDARALRGDGRRRRARRGQRVGGAGRGGRAAARQRAVDRGRQSPEPRPRRRRRAARASSPRCSAPAAGAWTSCAGAGGCRRCFARPGGERLRARLEAMSNVEYQRLLRAAGRRAAQGPGDRRRRRHRRRARPAARRRERRRAAPRSSPTSAATTWR